MLLYFFFSSNIGFRACCISGLCMGLPVRPESTTDTLFLGLVHALKNVDGAGKHDLSENLKCFPEVQEGRKLRMVVWHQALARFVHLLLELFLRVLNFKVRLELGLYCPLEVRLVHTPSRIHLTFYSLNLLHQTGVLQ